MQNCTLCGLEPDDLRHCTETSCSNCDPAILEIVAEYKKASGAVKVHFSVDPQATSADAVKQLQANAETNNRKTEAV